MTFKRYELPCVILVGGLAYMGLETVWRGYSHWSMGICGGLCFLFIYLFEITKSTSPLPIKCLFGALVITAAEFCTGVLVNIVFDWRVWDYSDRFLNLFGQVCPAFSMLWFFLSVPAFFIAKILRTKIFMPIPKNESEEKA